VGFRPQTAGTTFYKPGGVRPKRRELRSINQGGSAPKRRIYSHPRYFCPNICSNFGQRARAAEYTTISMKKHSPIPPRHSSPTRATKAGYRGTPLEYNRRWGRTPRGLPPLIERSSRRWGAEPPLEPPRFHILPQFRPHLRHYRLIRQSTAHHLIRIFIVKRSEILRQ